MTDLDKAREWAEDGKGLYSPGSRAKAAIDIIQSLPDQWVDAEKLREAIEGCDKMTYPYEVIEHIEKTLFATKLPTLADLIEQGHDVDDYLFTWVDTEDGLQLVTMTGDFDYRTIYTMDNRGYRLGKSWEEVTPRPDLPKLEWPGDGVVDCEIVDESPDGQQPNTSETPKSSIKPDEVPPNEPWLIEVDGEKAIGTRYQGDAFAPWSVAALDGSFADDYGDSEITLIHKLVPEPPALPEGMRLADHETLGRIVVSQRADEDGDYAFFESIPGGIAGAGWGYVNESELTFLDGGN